MQRSFNPEHGHNFLNLQSFAMSVRSLSSPSEAMNDTPPPPIMYSGIALPHFPPLVADVNGRMEAIQSMKTRDDDVFLVAYVKSGTHWLWEIMHMLHNGKTEYTKEVKENVFIEAVDDLEVLDNRRSPRVLNTHLPYRLLPRKHIQNKGKVVHMVRNPKDILVSHFHHLKQYGEYGPVPSHVGWSDFFNYAMKSPVQVYGGWFAYEKEFLEVEKNDSSGSIMTLHFEELKRNTDKEIKRLADFLGVQCSDQLVDDIVEMTSFKNLKLADDNIKTERVEDPATRQIKIAMKDIKAVADLKSPSMYRKGEIGDWKNHFTVAQNELFDSVYEAEMKDSKLKVAFE